MLLRFSRFLLQRNYVQGGKVLIYHIKKTCNSFCSQKRHPDIVSVVGRGFPLTNTILGLKYIHMQSENIDKGLRSEICKAFLILIQHCGYSPMKKGSFKTCCHGSYAIYPFSAMARRLLPVVLHCF